jgi:exodeoxyribonuclease III
MIVLSNGGTAQLPETVTELTVATWNVNSIGAHIQQVLGWLEAHQPAVLAMQETQCTAYRFPRAGFEALGYEIAAHGDGGSNGVALASRVGLHEIEVGVAGAPSPFNEPRILSARLDSGLRVISAYAPNGRKVGTDSHTFKVAWFELLRTVVEHADEPHVVVAADLNVAPTDNDVWDAHRYRSRNLTSPDDRRAYGRLIDLGLVDVVRKHSGSEKLSSWWNRRGDFFESDRGWRLDHVLASTELAQRSVGVHIDREIRRVSGGSDHAPITATFVLER